MGDYDDLGEYDVEPDEWDPYQCEDCKRWTEAGSFSELDGSFICDECATGYSHTYQDCD